MIVLLPIPRLVTGGLSLEKGPQELLLQTGPPAGQIPVGDEIVDLQDGNAPECLGQAGGEGAFPGAGAPVHCNEAQGMDAGPGFYLSRQLVKNRVRQGDSP